mgnify:FL=1
MFSGNRNTRDLCRPSKLEAQCHGDRPVTKTETIGINLDF